MFERFCFNCKGFFQHLSDCPHFNEPHMERLNEYDLSKGSVPMSFVADFEKSKQTCAACNNFSRFNAY